MPASRQAAAGALIICWAPKHCYVVELLNHVTVVLGMQEECKRKATAKQQARCVDSQEECVVLYQHATGFAAVDCVPDSTSTALAHQIPPALPSMRVWGNGPRSATELYTYHGSNGLSWGYVLYDITGTETLSHSCSRQCAAASGQLTSCQHLWLQHQARHTARSVHKQSAARPP